MAFSVTLVNVSPRGSLRIVTDDGAQIVERDGTVDVMTYQVGPGGDARPNGSSS